MKVTNKPSINDRRMQFRISFVSEHHMIRKKLYIRCRIASVLPSVKPRQLRSDRIFVHIYLAVNFFWLLCASDRSRRTKKIKETKRQRKKEIDKAVQFDRKIIRWATKFSIGIYFACNCTKEESFRVAPYRSIARCVYLYAFACCLQTIRHKKSMYTARFAYCICSWASCSD